jgi:hypothetical protein
MSVKSSPYQAVSALTVADEIIQGDHLQEGNIFEWMRVRLNLPGDLDYDPNLPWVSKVREDGRIAANLFTFVDDLRPTGPGKKNCWRAARRAGSVLSWLGIQDASRKRRDSSQPPGAWAGSVIRANIDGVFVLSDEEKCIKAKGFLQEILDLVEAYAERMPRYRLEEVQGFLVYVTRTYPCMRSYLIGMHMTIDSWQDNRDAQGWRLSAREMRLRSNAADEFEGEENEADDPEAPDEVRAVPRLGDGIRALQSLMVSDQRVRCRKASEAYYGFGDASGLAFGTTIQIGDKIWYEYGQWSSEVVEEKSSNWREFTNLVEFLENAILRHKLEGSELFIFTDNSTSESAFWKGMSSSPLTFELVLRLKKIGGCDPTTQT